MGKVVDYLPAGFSDSEDEYYGEIDGYYYERTPKNFMPIEKSQIEIFKTNLLNYLNNNNINALRDELDNGSIKGFDIDSEVSHGWNLLFHACFNGLFSVVEFLISERGVNTNLFVDQESPVMTACKSNEDSNEILKIVKLLVKEATNINTTNSYGVTSLMLACGKGHLKTVEFLIAKGASIDAIDNNGFNALFHAIENKQVEIAKLLIESGIDLNLVDKQGNTAKITAFAENLQEILELFPPEEYRYTIPTNFLSYSDFTTIIPNTFGHNEVPAYFPDIMNMLRGMSCENLAPSFAQAEITLQDFLTMTDTRLTQIGIEMPYQRDTIRLGLFNFYNAKWSRKSMIVPSHLKTHVSSLDLIYTLANLLRQIVVMKCQLQFYRELNFKINANDAERFLTLEHLNNFQGHVENLRELLERIKPTHRALLIEKKKNNITKKAVISCASAVSVIFLIYLFRK